MGLANYMSRNPSELAKPPNDYNGNLIIAQIDIMRETLHIIRKRGRLRKQQNQPLIDKKVETFNDSTTRKNNTLELHDESNHPKI